MKPINIKFGDEQAMYADGNLVAIILKVESALAAANGKASSHTYKSRHEIFDLAKKAEKRLADLGIPKAERPGARYWSTSGGSVPNAYKYGRKATAVSLERKSTGWFLVGVTAVVIYGDAGHDGLGLTKKQDETAVAKFRAGYYVTAD